MVEAIKKTSPKATDNSRYAGSFVKRNRRRIIVGREDKSALNTISLLSGGRILTSSIWHISDLFALP